jgi:hypothetical protein
VPGDGFISIKVSIQPGSHSHRKRIIMPPFDKGNGTEFPAEHQPISSELVMEALAEGLGRMALSNNVAEKLWIAEEAARKIGIIRCMVGAAGDCGAAFNRPSTLLRTAPPLRFASVLSPSRLEPLVTCPFTPTA